MAKLMPVPVASAGRLAPRPPAMRWLLLACTLFGLAAMHTVGHAGPGHAMAMPDRPAIHHLRTMLAANTAHVTAPIGYRCPDGCVHLGSPGPAGGHPDGWSVCLAVLAAFAIAMLVGWLLRAATNRGTANRSTRPLTITPRAPPPPRVGLLLADLSVLRR